jgi:hypothetical protein
VGGRRGIVVRVVVVVVVVVGMLSSGTWVGGGRCRL